MYMAQAIAAPNMIYFIIVYFISIFSGSIPDEFDNADKSDLAGMASGELKCSNQLWS